MSCKIFLLACLCVVFFDLVQSPREINTEDDCPNKGRAEYGDWRIDKKDGIKRCILRCNDGFEPSGCHVLRMTDKTDGWNYNVPTCVKEKWITLDTVGKVAGVMAVGAGAVAAAPFVISGVGFTSAGVAAGSVAAGLQGSTVAAGGWFAALQSAGAAGLATTTQGAIFAGVSSVTGAVTSILGACEKE